MENRYLKNFTFLLLLVFTNVFINAQNFTNYSPLDGLIQGGIYSIIEDQNNVLWFGSWTNPEETGGLGSFDGTTFNQYSTDNGLAGNNVTVVFEDSAYNLWIGTRTGVSKFDGSVITNYTVDNGLVFNEVWDILEDTNENIWFSTHQGVSMFDGITWTNYTLEDYPALVYVNDIMMDANGHIWFGSAGGGGISKFDGVTWTNYTTENSGLVANDVFEVYQDTDNNYWFATYSGNGLSKFDGTTWTTYTTADGLSNNKVRVITQDSFGDLWFGTNTGLSRYNGSSWKTYTTADGLIPGGVRAITQDSNDDLWVGTWSSGLSKLEISKVAIPDGIFEKSLIQIGIDSDMIINGQVLRKDVFEVTELILTNPLSETNPLFHNELIDLDPLTEKITYLTGIEAFTSLTKLGLSYSDLESVDLSYNKELDDLFLTDAQLTEIDISKNTKLTRFGVIRNPYIGTVDVSKNTLLKELFLENTGITTIDLTNNLDLWKIRLENNNLTSLNISNNINLEELRCQNNNLTGVNTSFNTKLIDINVRYNAPLTYLNLKNGNNKYVTRFDIRDTALTCITADGDYVSISESDSGVSQLMFNYSGGLLSEDCGTVYIPDPNFEQALIDLGVDQSDILDGVILRSEAETVGWLDISNSNNGYGIQDLTGIEAFTSLTGINCNSNQIANLDFSSNPLLRDVYANECSIETINVTNNPDLVNLHVYLNQISELNLGNNLMLEELICQSNQITSLDLSVNGNLRMAFCAGNQLTSLNIANGNNLNFTPPSWTNVSFGADGNPDLQCIQVDADILFSIPAHWVKDDIAVYDDDCSSFTSDWGIAGSATPNGWGGPDIVVEATNVANVFEVITDLTDGLIKFRRNNNWAENYGDLDADGTLDVPPNALDIPVTAGTYKIVMDLNNLTYSISPYIPILGVVGSATPGGWNNNNGIPDIVLTFNEDLNMWTGNANLTNGEIKFRYENDWSVNFGDDGLDNTLDPNGANIPVAEGFYFVRVDLNGMTYSLEDPYVSIPDSNFEQALIDLGLDGNIGDPINGFILKSDAETITDLNINSKGIINLTGIEAFTNLSVLYCQNNQLQELDVTQNTALTVLECEGNGLTELIVTQNPLLRVLGFGPNNLTEIDVSQNLLLEAIWSNGNNLSTIDLDANTKLVVYGLSNNPYKYVSLKNGNNVNVHYFEANSTQSLDCINSDAIVSAQMSSSGKTFSEDCSTSIAGKWIIAPEPGALKVGQVPGSDEWWALNIDDIANRGCYLDDVYEFNEDGSFNNILGSSTWLEPFQGVATEQCGAPVAPHDGSVNANYAYNQLAGTITLNGKGAYLGLPKVVNGGILSDQNAAPESIVYDVSFSENGNVMTLSINFGPGFFTYKFLKESVFIPDPNFEQALIDLGLDSDGEINKRILRSDAEAVTGRLGVCCRGITDLTGIEAFINITELQAGENQLTSIDLSQNTELLKLWVYFNQLTELDLSNNTKLQRVSAGGNQLDSFDSSTLIDMHTLLIWQNSLVSLDLTNNVNLTWLSAQNNQLIDVNLEANTLLDRIELQSNVLPNINLANNVNVTSLFLMDNPLNAIDITTNTKLLDFRITRTGTSSLDLSNNIVLETLIITENEFTDLDLTTLPNLSQFFANNNRFVSIDVSKNPKLEHLLMADNPLQILDVSNNPILTALNIDNNTELVSLDIRNGNNVYLTDFLVGNTSNLTCINADGIGAPDISQTMIDAGIDFEKTFSKDCGDFVYIPDPNFEQSLIDIGFDSDGVVNTSILRSDAGDPTKPTLNLNNSLFTPDWYGFNNPAIVNVTGKIADLTGIEAFINLTNLQISYSDLTTIDVSNNTLLEELWVTDGILTGIDVTSNTNLIQLGVSANNITGTVDVSENTALELLFIGINPINSLDVTSNTSLSYLWVPGTQITSLDISFNSNLQRLDAQYNPGLSLITDPAGYPAMTSLNLSGINLANYNQYAPLFQNLQWLLLNDNSLTRFNSNNALLVENLFLNNNSIDKLLLSSNTALKQVHATNNVLTELDVKNGNNLALQTLNVTDNLLTCINVDDPLDGSMPYASWNTDLGVVLSDNCSAEPEIVLIPDENFEQKLIDEGIDLDGIGLNGSILLSDALATTQLDVYLSGITDMTGIEAFENLESLNASDNNFSEIDLTNCTNLVTIDLSFNNLTTLNVTSGRVLTLLYVGGNNLTTLNLGELTNLTNVDLSFNDFESIDASSLDQLLVFSIYNNNLSTLDMRNGNNAAMVDFSAENNTNLFCVGVDDPASISNTIWKINGATVFSSNSDCVPPTVVTKDVPIFLDNKGKATAVASQFDNGSTDNVTANANLVFSLNKTVFSCSNFGANVVELSVTDEAGNVGIGYANVIVNDAIPPIARAVREHAFDLAGGNTTLNASILNNGSTDNCSIASFSLSQSYFTLPGIYYVDFIARDIGGNEGRTQVKLTVSDSDNSEILTVGNVTVTVYPNPFQDYISLKFSKNMDFSTVNVSLTDFNGNPTVASFAVQDLKNLKATGLSGLAPGSYILTVSKGRKSDTAIMIKN